ncbi:hypothetical protein CCU68_18770 [Pseudomonas gingeri NCPPB 3146 = LMG 5327]|uniref:Uncharacterized protein n=2 Tax=Pseudomonas gingeri TaxID=117681 RepID=A0A7Y7XYV7_9PSED|nr:hypothetical protein [Pseudomonas gingeri]NWC14859.1 hypothetical protein [Pseudomonas gingeri]PNQ91022.1 hypothetical protein CCU68_18770 [Pseudomonas gingeri NCPPB 3146 = LMG 5327]
MKYYIDRRTNQVFAFEADGSQDACIGPDLEALDERELAAFQAANVDPKIEIIRKIAELESQVTPRRLRETLLTDDKSFIKVIDDNIVELRLQL